MTHGAHGGFPLIVPVPIWYVKHEEKSSRPEQGYDMEPNELPVGALPSFVPYSIPFRYEGREESCGLDRPHPPHRLGTRRERYYYYYSENTWVYVDVDVYCLGREGPVEINGRRYYLKIVAHRTTPERYWSHDAHAGYYYLIPLDDVTEALLNMERGLRTDRAGGEQG